MDSAQDPHHPLRPRALRPLSPTTAEELEAARERRRSSLEDRLSDSNSRKASAVAPPKPPAPPKQPDSALSHDAADDPVDTPSVPSVVVGTSVSLFYFMYWYHYISCNPSHTLIGLAGTPNKNNIVLLVLRPGLAAGDVDRCRGERNVLGVKDSLSAKIGGG